MIAEESDIKIISWARLIFFASTNSNPAALEEVRIRLANESVPTHVLLNRHLELTKLGYDRKAEMENPTQIKSISLNPNAVPEEEEVFETDAPLQAAICGSNIELVRLLLEYLPKDDEGKKVFQVDCNEYTIWHACVAHVACYADDKTNLGSLKEIIGLLTEHPNALAQLADLDAGGRTPKALLEKLNDEFIHDSEITDAAWGVISQAVEALAALPAEVHGGAAGDDAHVAVESDVPEQDLDVKQLAAELGWENLEVPSGEGLAGEGKEPSGEEPA